MNKHVEKPLQWEKDSIQYKKAVDGRLTRRIDVSQPVLLQADSGLSSGVKSAIASIHGQDRIIPLYDGMRSKDGETGSDAGTGNNLEYNVVEWGVARVIDSSFGGC